MVDDGTVLLVRRAYPESPWHGAWCAPGGFCEVGEHPIQTLEREVFEETGLRVQATGYLGVWVDAYADQPAPEEAEVINVGYYLAVVVGPGGSVDPAEVSEVAWFSWGELPENLAPPGTLESVLGVARAAHEQRVALSHLADRPR